MFECFKRKKGYFICLVLLSVVAIVLGIIAAINFDSTLTIDLKHIAYIKFLRGSGGFVGMIFGLVLSLSVFFCFIMLSHWKPYLLPLGALFYLYLVYSQAVIIVSIILVFGIMNCIVLAIFLLIYSFLIWTLFLLMCCEMSCHCGEIGYFKTCCSLRASKTMLHLLCAIVTTIVFSIILIILKNYVLLLVFE